MASNDFVRVGEVCADAFVLDWPQSNERIRGVANFARINHEYPAQGAWRFDIERITGDARQAVTVVRVTDGVTQGCAISFFECSEGRIDRIVEYWPEPYAPATDRAHLVEPIVR